MLGEDDMTLYRKNHARKDDGFDLLLKQWVIELFWMGLRCSAHE
jgi:hypothetical protein